MKEVGIGKRVQFKLDRCGAEGARAGIVPLVVLGSWYFGDRL